MNFEIPRRGDNHMSPLGGIALPQVPLSRIFMKNMEKYISWSKRSQGQ